MAAQVFCALLLATVWHEPTYCGVGDSALETRAPRRALRVAKKKSGSRYRPSPP